MVERLTGVRRRWRGEELCRHGLGLGHSAERRRGSAPASATEALQAQFLQCREEGSQQRCRVEGGGVKGGGAEVGQPDGAKPKGLRD
jgi:hypothetical protein